MLHVVPVHAVVESACTIITKCLVWLLVDHRQYQTCAFVLDLVSAEAKRREVLVVVDLRGRYEIGKCCLYIKKIDVVCGISTVDEILVQINGHPQVTVGDAHEADTQCEMHTLG